MKKLFKTIILATAIVFFGCAGMNTVDNSPVRHHLDLNVVSVDKVKMDTKEIEGWAPEMSGLSYVIEDTGYMKIFAGISVSDTQNLWNDLNIMRAEGITDVKVFLNSGGGGAFDGIAIARCLMKARVDGMYIEMHASGVVASAAIPILSAGSKRFALEGTIFMVHEAALWKWPGRETASDIRSQAALMDLLRNSYLSIMETNTTTSFEKWGEMEGETVWFNTETAKKLGLIDEIE